MEIRETIKDFEVTFTFDHSKLTAVKSIPGSWYQGNARVWHVPKFRTREINFLRQKFNVHELKIVNVPIQESYDDVPPLPDLDCELPLIREPFPFQKTGIAYCRKNKRVIIGDQPGLGKSLEAIGTICSFGINQDKMLALGPGLIICPSSLKINWQKEWMVNAGHRSMILVDSIKNTWQSYYNVGMCDVFIVNYESLKKYFVQPGWKKPSEGQFKMNHIPFRATINIFKWVIIDESHKVKDGSTMQAKLSMGIARGKEVILELTGTPILNKARDLISQLHVIDRLRDIVEHIPRPVDKHGKLSDYSGYTRFVNRYCGGGNESTNLNELNYRLNKFCFFRREKSDVLKDLPAKMRQVVRCDITNRTEYDRAENEFVTYLKDVRGCSDQEIKKKLRGQMMVKIGILKQISAKGKLEAAKEFIEEVTEGGQKIVVFVHLKEIAKALKQIFPEAVGITGDDDAYARDRAITHFQKHDDTKIIVCSLQAGGVGITLTASSEVLFVEFPWTFALCEQAEDRTHRIGQDNNVRATYLLGDNTIDEYCYEVIQKKKSIAQDITGATDDVVEEMIDNLLSLFNQK
jgi:SWI/SNF-related matrix-associated actin-dependent regulator 1 of chromatin subfamily A